MRTTKVALVLLMAAILAGSLAEAFPSEFGIVHAQTMGSAVTLASSTTAPTSTGYPFQRREFVADNRFWFFTVASGTAGWQSCLVSSPCGSDPSSWTPPTTIHSSVGPGGLSVWYNATSNLVFYGIGIGGPQFLYRYGTPKSDGTIAWSIPERSVSTTGTGDDLPYVLASYPGNVWISVATLQNGASHLELWHYNGASWVKSIDLVGRGKIGGIALPLTGSQYGLVTGDVVGSGDKLMVYTSGDGGTTWTSGTAATSAFSLDEAQAISIGNGIYVAGQTSGFFDTFFSCAYPCSSPLAETTLASGLPNNDVWATLSTDGSQVLVVAYEAGPSTVDFVESTDLGASWSPTLVLSSSEVLSDIDFSGTAAPFIVGDTVIFGWTDGLASPFSIRFAGLSLSNTSSSSSSTTVTTTVTTVTTVTVTSAAKTTVKSACAVTFTFLNGTVSAWSAAC